MNIVLRKDVCSGVYIIVFPGNGRPARDTHVSGGRGRDLNWSFPPNSEMFCIYILGPGNMCLKYKMAAIPQHTKGQCHDTCAFIITFSSLGL